MSIKIIITSPASLTKREIDDLRDYLLIAASGAMAEATVTEPNDLLPTLEDVNARSPKSRKKRIAKPSPFKVVSETVGDTKIVDFIAPPPAPSPLGTAGSVAAWSVGNSDQQALRQVETCDVTNSSPWEIVLPDALPAHGYKYEVFESMTHDELVAWVLENVREMRLNFDNVLEVVTSFGIPTLSLIGLKEHPELIMPAYDKFKNLVDN